MKSLKDRVVVITGAGSGIGRSLALACAARGARVAICDKNRTALQETVSLLEDQGAAVLARELDVSAKGEFHAFAQKVQEQWGGAAVLINNAGVALSESFVEMSRSDFEWLFNINFWGVVNGCEAFLPQIQAQEEGAIINISSCFGLVAMPTQSAYCASKFAVRGFTEALRAELRKTSVHTMVVHPGGVRTNIVRNGKHYQQHTQASMPQDLIAERFDKIALSSPEQVAEKILRALQKKQGRLVVGPDALVFDWLARFSPRLSNVVASWMNHTVPGPVREVQKVQKVG